MSKELEYLYQLLERKEKQTLSAEELEKLQLAKDIFQIPNCFFELEFEVAIGLLDFLDVPEQDILSLYFKLISSNSFIKKSEKVTLIKEK